MIFLLLICIKIFSIGGTVSEEPSFVEPIPNITIAAGRDIRLSCVVDNLGTYKVAWIAFDKSAILTVQDHVITRNPRVRVTHDGQRTWTLHISRVNSSDAGTYMCQVNTILAKSQFGVLSVVVPPNIVDTETSGDVTVAEDSKVNLTCNASGTPQPSITWRREDNQKININKTLQVTEHNGVILNLEKISRMDMAAYLCIARNGVPPIVSKRIQVAVEFPPMMNIPHQLVGAPVTFSIIMECTIEAHPAALTYWSRGDRQSQMLHHGNKYHIINMPGEVSYRIHMKLTVQNISTDDYGTYMCIAKNSMGESQGNILLYETQPPTMAPTTPPSYLGKLFQGLHYKTTNIASTTKALDTVDDNFGDDTDEERKEEVENNEDHPNELMKEKEVREEKHIQGNERMNHKKDKQERHFTRFISHGVTVYQPDTPLIMICFGVAVIAHLSLQEPL